jgi:hypothetical protein
MERENDRLLAQGLGYFPSYLLRTGSFYQFVSEIFLDINFLPNIGAKRAGTAH